MNLNFVSSFKNCFAGKMKNIASSVLSNYGIRTELQKYANQLKAKTAAADNVLLSLQTVLQTCATTLPSIIPQEGSFQPDFTVTIDADAAEMLISSLEQAISTSDLVKSAHLSDSRGYTYDLCVVMWNGRKSIATTLAPKDLSDLVCYFDNSNWHVNQIVKSTGFLRGWEVPGINIFNTMELVCDWEEIPSESTTLIDMLNSILTWNNAPVQSTIGDCLSSLVLIYGAQVGSTYLETATAIARKVVSIDDFGVVTYIGDVFRDVGIAQTMNDIMVKAVEFICNVNSNAAEFREYISGGLSGSCVTVKNFIDGLVNAYLTGGFYGVARYILDILQGVASIEYTDGVLSFTDNASLVPVQYIAGFIGQAINTVASIAAAAVAFVQPAISAIISVAGSVLGAPFIAANYDYETNTRSGFELASKTISIPVCPLALFQIELPLVNFRYSSMRGYFNQVYDSGEPIQIGVPGGMVFVGKSPNASYPAIRLEFHACYDRVLKWDLTQSRPAGWNSDAYTIANVTFTTSSLEEYWNNNAIRLIDAYEFSSSGVLTSDSDDLMRSVVESNIGLFLLWIRCSYESVTTSDRSDAFFGMWLSTTGTAPGNFHPVRNLVKGSCLNLLIQYSVYVSSAKILKPYSWTALASFCASFGSSDEFNVVEIIIPAPEGTLSEMNIADSELSTFWLYELSSSSVFSLSLLPSIFSYELHIPKYDKNTFYLWVGLVTIATVAVAAATVVVSLKIKRWRQAKRASLNAKTANTWNNYERSMAEYDPDDPSDNPAYHTPEYREQCLNEYRNTVKVNNLWSNITGGTKYSKSGYWDEDDYSVSAPTSESGEDGFISRILTLGQEDVNVNETTSRSIQDVNTIDKIYATITGIAVSTK